MYLSNVSPKSVCEYLEKKKKKMETIDNETRSIVPVVISRVIFVKILV